MLARRSSGQIALLCAIASLSIFLMVVASSRLDDAHGQSAGAPAQTADQELPEYRTRTSRTFRSADGTLTTRVHPQSVNFRSGGKWRTIDNRLVADEAVSGRYVNALNRYRLQLPASLGAAPVSLADQGDVVSFTMLEAGGVAQVAGPRATYADAFPGVDVRYTAMADAVKEELVLADADVPREYRFRLDLSDALRAREDGNGGIEFVDAEGQRRMAFAPPVVFDSAPRARVGRHAALSLDETGGKPEAVLRLDMEWLRDPARVFPVTVDPYLNIDYPADDCFISQSTPDTGRCNEELEVGYDGAQDRALLRFDVSALSKDAVVLWTELAAKVATRSTTTPMSVAVHEPTKAWSAPNASWNKYDGTNLWSSPGGDFVATAIDTNTAVGDCTACLEKWEVGELVRRWVNKETPNNGLLIKAVDATAANHVEFESNQFGTVPPTLTVKWKHQLGVRPHFTYESWAVNDRSTMRVNVANGNLVLEERDLMADGIGLDLGYSRYYNHLDVDGGDNTVGFRWNQSIGYDTQLDFSCTCNGQVVRFDAPSGYHVAFRKKPDGTYRTPPGMNMTMTKNPDGTFDVVENQSRNRMKFNSSGRLTRVEDRNGLALTFAYAGPSGKLSTITDTRGRQVTFSYLTNGDPDKMTDWSGRVWDYTVTNGNLTMYRNPDGKDTIYGYNAGARLNSITDPRGNQITIGEDALNRVTSITRKTASTTDVDPQWTFDYRTTVDAPCDPAKHLGKTVETDPRGKQTTYCYDRQLRVDKTVDAAGHERSTKWTANSDVEEFTNGTGTASALSKSTYAADGTNNLTGGTSPAGEKFSMDYADTANKHQPTRYESPQGTSTRYGYDANGNTTSTKNGNVGETEDSSVTIDYRRPDDGTPGSDWQIEWIEDKKLNRTSYEYNASGHLSKVIPPLPLGPTTFTYDAVSRIRTVTDGMGRVTTYDYDPLDRVKKITFNDATTVTYTYDANGNQTSRVDSKDATTSTYVYDELNRRSSETIAGVTSNYSYDRTGNLLTLADAGGTVTYTYDDVNRLKTAQAPGDPAATVYTYDPRGTVGKIEFPNGVVTTQTYDASDKVKTIETVKGTTQIMKRTYTYQWTPTGSTTAREGGLRETETTGAGRKTTYAYDRLDRLDTATVRTSSGTLLDSYDYDYDAASNRTKAVKNSTTTSYAYNAANQLCWRANTAIAVPTCATPPTGAVTYGYDANGNETSNSEGRSASYNDRNQTTSLTPPGGTAQTLKYFSPNQMEWRQHGTTTITNTLTGLAAAKAGTAQAIHYTRTPGGGLIGQRNADTTGRLYYHLDALGSVIAVTDSAGTRVGDYDYDPYGQALTTTGTDVAFRYAGQYRSTSLALYKMGLRYYDMKIGRWTQPDPLDQTGDLTDGNRYMYVGGDPINNVDPNGTHKMNCVWLQLSDAERRRRGISHGALVPQCRAAGPHQHASGLRAGTQALCDVGSALIGLGATILAAGDSESPTAGAATGAGAGIGSNKACMAMANRIPK